MKPTTLSFQEAGKQVDAARKIAANKSRDLKNKQAQLERAEDADAAAQKALSISEEALRVLMRKK